MNHIAPHPLTDCRTYELRGITYVPHYLIEGTYVGPGSRLVTHNALKKTPGVKETTTMLWPRRWAVEHGLQEPDPFDRTASSKPQKQD